MKKDRLRLVAILESLVGFVACSGQPPVQPLQAASPVAEGAVAGVPSLEYSSRAQTACECSGIERGGRPVTVACGASTRVRSRATTAFGVGAKTPMAAWATVRRSRGRRRPKSSAARPGSGFQRAARTLVVGSLTAAYGVGEQTIGDSLAWAKCSAVLCRCASDLRHGRAHRPAPAIPAAHGAMEPFGVGEETTAASSVTGRPRTASCRYGFRDRRGSP
jgi:hypothetical protein